MLLVARSFQILRRRAKVIHLLAALSAALVTPVLTLLLAILWLVPIIGGFGFSVPDIFRSLQRFFSRLYSGRALRPLTLRSVSGARF